ncbi:MAG: hypothetical protein KTR32_04235 [Granulosicoccus sp.]|nr:hypothetical protein [Granulosicoccus sp.]
MKRKNVHAGFALLSATFAIIATVQLSTLNASKQTRSAIAAVGITAKKPIDPAARLAWANLHSAEGNFETAESAFNELVRENQGTPLGLAAQFNLANGYLRIGMQDDLDPAKSGPMIELAKQRYRDLLREDPEDWAAKYNLERALILAPETGSKDKVDDKGKPIKRVNVVVPDFKIRDLP